MEDWLRLLKPSQNIWTLQDILRSSVLQCEKNVYINVVIKRNKIKILFLKGFEPVVLNPWESNSFFFRLPAWMLHLSCLEVCSFGRCFSISFYVSAGSPLAFCNPYFDDIFFHKTVLSTNLRFTLQNGSNSREFSQISCQSGNGCTLIKIIILLYIRHKNFWKRV